jgi:hypothetical protein
MSRLAHTEEEACTCRSDTCELVKRAYERQDRLRAIVFFVLAIASSVAVNLAVRLALQ